MLLGISLALVVTDQLVAVGCFLIAVGGELIALRSVLIGIRRRLIASDDV
ncbi:MAG: hypothetical protein WKF96_14260 [Solirubrobacteraceae bacterium]